MGAAEDVRAQFIAETNTLYEGSSNPKKLPDLRAMIKYITWDLLRFQKPKDFTDADTSHAVGLRDSVSRQHLLAEQNNWMLRKLCKTADVDLTGMP